MIFSGLRARRAILAIMASLALVWFAQRSILVAAAAFLVEEDPLVPADILVVSNSMPRAAALEAALLYNQRVSSHIVIADWVPDPVTEKVHRLGIPYLDVSELSKAILERSGVPPSAITILDDRVDGTEAEVSAIAAYVSQRRLSSVLVVTARSHTARTKWLLHRKLPRSTHVIVLSPRFDQFSIAWWWRERDQTREVIIEYLRWFNTLFLPDLWRRTGSYRADLRQHDEARDLSWSKETPKQSLNVSTRIVRSDSARVATESRATDRREPILLDLGLTQRPVVDADLVDTPLKPLTP